MNEVKVVKVTLLGQTCVYAESSASEALIEIAEHINTAFAQDDMSIDSNINISFGRMKESELESLPEFQGY